MGGMETAASLNPPRIMASGLSEQQYLAAFEKAVGGYRVEEIAGAATRIDDSLFRNAAGELKLLKRGRELYVEHLANTITAPDAIYEASEALRSSPGQTRTVRRFLKTFGDSDSAIRSVVVFTRDSSEFKGTTAFVPFNGKGDVDIAYFEKQRIGAQIK